MSDAIAASRRARRAADARRRRAGIETERRRSGPTGEIPCVVCHGAIVGHPDGWMHVADRRQFALDGHEAAPRTIP